MTKRQIQKFDRLEIRSAARDAGRGDGNLAKLHKTTEAEALRVEMRKLRSRGSRRHWQSDN